MIDFGFAPQFGRNITYVFSGVQQLNREGLNTDVDNSINYHLLQCLIDVAKKVYRCMSIIVLLLMLTCGTIYMYKVTDGFTSVKNSCIVWIIYSISTYFNVYFYYYSSLLSGRGQIKEARKAMIASRITYLLLSFSLILAGLGLMGLCIANLISPFVSRWISYRYFYDDQLREALSKEHSTSREIKELFFSIWFNAKRLGITTIGAYAVFYFSLFVAGIYLTLSEVSSFGLMMQLVAIISAVSNTLFMALAPQMTSYRVERNNEQLIRLFSWSMNIVYILFISMSLALLLLGPIVLKFLGSNAQLPSNFILALYLIITFLEQNHSLYAGVITMGNSVPYYKAGLISGFFVCLGDVLILQFTGIRLLGLVLVQGFVQVVYQNWYWPRWVCKEFGVSFPFMVKLGFIESFNKFKAVIASYNRFFR